MNSTDNIDGVRNSNENINIGEILSKVDHTLLSPVATWEEIKKLCDEGAAYGVASVCIPASYVSQARDYIGNQVKICTVAGFPNGYSTTAVKCFEAEDAVKNGADEIDAVINIGWLKDKKYAELISEINEIKRACGEKLLKIIVETCLLTEEEKISICKIVSSSSADYIKTSTGFSSSGATFHDVELFSKYASPRLKIKAAGGISSIEDAERFISLGASRLGTSRIVKIVKEKMPL